ncbi:uncharacterized protein LOC129610093 [Condylostylus longicornis]|uniref:uncharacterized protein LOC129610093 n=1 Tax=Condylostylus longicornis TaxID=2530218 RepID=UPI00244E43BC|nr:uncharacterized protein LOC129610093 [Condylostylus longicornis]
MNENDEKVIRVGSRKSELALIQTKHVISELQKQNPGKIFEIHTMSTIGDRILNVSLPKIGEKSLFTRDLEDALKHGRVDFIVHSLKDLPTTLPQGMTIGAVLEREDSRDALVLNDKYKSYTLQTLPKNALIGTSSLRRTAQIRRKFPHLEICDIRGNLNTRLAKLDAPNSKFAGIILAQAGLVRMGWTNRISQILEPCELMYCVGQGALAVECRTDDEITLSMLKNLICLPTTCKILAERSFLRTLGGGCSAPVAVYSNLSSTSRDSIKCLNNSNLSLRGAVWSLDGKSEIMDEVKGLLEIRKRRKTEEYSTTEDEDDLEVSPSKRSRLDKNVINDYEGEKKIESPRIINDDPTLESFDGKIPNIEHLIKVHGDLFKKCPHLQKKITESGLTNLTKDKCPLMLPVGDDFMGECPVADTEEKVQLVDLHTKTEFEVTNGELKVHHQEENGNISKPSFSDKFNNSLSNESHNQLQDFANNNLKENSNTTFASNSKKPESTSTEKISISGEKHEGCPFLKVKLVDHVDEGKSNEISERSLSPELLESECRNLFCGIFRHKCFDKNLFKKCDDLGRDLALNLINKGALAIMKIAQDEIRQNVK